MNLYEIFEDSPDIDIPYDLIAELEIAEAKAASSKLPSASEINKETIKIAVTKWKKHEGDVGSAEVQIVTANERIKYLTKHLLTNKKDKAAMRGLDALVNARRRFLNYLYKTDQSKAEAMVAELGIRFRPTGQVWDKETKYRAFRNTKSKWQKIRAEKKAQKTSPNSA
jgi:small subunit ribosomal protein S15